MITVKTLTKIYKSPVKTGNIISDIFHRTYRTQKALNSVSFEIGESELVGFIGPNGAGKTTTMKILAGILYPTSGTVNILGFTPFDKDHAYLRQIAFLMGQKNQLLWELPATDTFMLNKEIYEVSDDQYKKTLDELVDLLEVSPFLDRPIKTLSLGQRMRMELIAALIHRPKILFLDEPTIGLDIFAQTTITKFIKEYQRRFNATIMLTSHYMQDIRRLAHRVILIDHGHIVYDGKLQTLIDTYSKTKTVTLFLDQEIQIQDLEMPKDVTFEYQYPQLKLRMDKKYIEKVLPKVLEKLEYNDLTIENETLEDIVKQTFKTATERES